MYAPEGIDVFSSTGVHRKYIQYLIRNPVWWNSTEPINPPAFLLHGPKVKLNHLPSINGAHLARRHAAVAESDSGLESVSGLSAQESKSPSHYKVTPESVQLLRSSIETMPTPHDRLGGRRT